MSAPGGVVANQEVLGSPSSARDGSPEAVARLDGS